MSRSLQLQALLEKTSETVRRRLEGAAGERFLERIETRARSAHPGFEVSPSFLSFVGARINEAILERGPELLFVEDLALVWGCLEAVPSALERFDQQILAPILRRLGTDSDTAQRVREKLWVGRRLEEYAGRGPLSAWTRMVVKRQVINDSRGEGPVLPAPSDDEAQNDPFLELAEKDPEFQALQADARAALKRSLQSALQALAPEELELLRLHHIQGVPHGELGKKFGLPRSTVAFRLEKARAHLLERARASLETLLGERRSDVDSLIRAVQGDWDLSLSILRPRL